MKLTLNTAALATALTTVSGAVARRSEIDILKHVRLTAGDGLFTIAGTNLDRETIATLGAGRIETGGDIAVDALALTSLVGKLPKGGDTEIALEGARLSVASGSVRASFPTLPGTMWQSLAGEGEVDDPPAQLDGEALATALTRISTAVGTDPTRYYLNGAWFEQDAEAGELILVATDGHRMASARIALPAETAWRNCIVPREALGDLTRLAESAEVIEVRFWGGDNPTRVQFAADGVALTTKLVDGNFPDWRRVVPRPDAAPALNVPAAALHEAATLASALSQDRSARCGVRAEGEGVRAWLDGEQREASTLIAATFDAEAFAESQGFVVNSRLLSDMAAVFGKAEISLQQVSKADAIRVTAADLPGLVYVLMPLRS